MATEAESTTPSPEGKPLRWPKHAVWLGVVITMAGFLSYFLFFFQYPALRDFPVVNLPLIILGVVLTAAGCRQVFKQGRIFGKIVAGLGMMLVLTIAGLFNFYIFAMSYQLPESVEAPATESAAPDFTLLGPDGQNVILSNYRGRKVVLVFYRGNW